jgi:hypothetical protein
VQVDGPIRHISEAGSSGAADLLPDGAIGIRAAAAISTRSRCLRLVDRPPSAMSALRRILHG